MAEPDAKTGWGLRRNRRGLLATSAAALMCATPAMASTGPTNFTAVAAGDLSNLSIEDLANIDISSVSKSDQPLSEAPAAVFVITHDDIIRSGVTRLADMLRLAPNLQVAQVTSGSFAISARGFNGTAASKLLVLIDGRTVYTPFVSGVYWDVQDVPPEDIERIEVISGPGATLWGANAVNGVINIITRTAADTQGVALEFQGGDRERRASLRYGGKLAENASYRLYAEAADHEQNVFASGADAHDSWRRSQGGFRLDWTPGHDVVTLQGDVYDGLEHYNGKAGQPRNAEIKVSGHNLLARWTTHPGAESTLQIQAYYDYLERGSVGVASYFLHTYDLDVQHSFSLGAAQEIVWGGGYRRTEDRFPIVPGNPSAAPFTQYFSPESRTLDLSNLFAQDTIALSPSLNLTLGLKLENEPYSGLATLPSARLSFQATDNVLLWAAVSRAVRAPSRLDRDFHQVLGSFVVIAPGNFQPETLVAYELGYRGRPSSRTSLSVSAFYNVYDALRTFERPAPGVYPITISNRMEGETYGVEAWGIYQATDWWRLSAGANWLRENLRFKPNSTRDGGISIAGNDPDYQASLRSAMTLPHGLDLDLQLRRVGALPEPASPAYTELNGRLGWALTKSVELSVSGFNLLNKHHPEFGTALAAVQLGAAGAETGRSVVVGARLRF